MTIIFLILGSIAVGKIEGVILAIFFVFFILFLYVIYYIYKRETVATVHKNVENSEEGQNQKIKWLDEVKQKALNVNNICERNKSSDKPLVSTIYQSSSQMKDIMNELTKVAELQGKVDAIADELSKKSGVQ